AALAERVLLAVAGAFDGVATVEITVCKSQIGSGALPVSLLPSAGLALRPMQSSGKAVERLAQKLRDLPIPVIGHIESGRLVLDLRCLEDEAGFVANLNSGLLWRSVASFPRKREPRGTRRRDCAGPPLSRGRREKDDPRHRRAYRPRQDRVGARVDRGRCR